MILKILLVFSLGFLGSGLQGAVEVFQNVEKLNENTTLNNVNDTELVTLLSEVFSDWSEWSSCQENGIIVRKKLCKVHHLCRKITITEEKPCSDCGPGGHCNEDIHDGLGEENDTIFYVVKEPSSRSIKRIGTNLIEKGAGKSGFEYFDHREIYSKWSKWTTCTKTCLTYRYKWCKKVSLCGNEVIRQTAYCYFEGTYCQFWVQSKFSKEWIAPANHHLPEIGSNNGHSTYHESGNQGNEVDAGTFDFEAKKEVKFTCGQMKNNLTTLNPSNWNMVRIIGGRPTQQGKWPWQVAILNRFKEAFCGGTLVAPKWVLTAAHCVRKRLYVRLGEHDLGRREGTELQLRVKKMVIHPGFNPDTVDNDVALLRLPHAVPLDSFSAACLPRSRQPLPTQQMCTIIGWGKRSNSDVYGTDVLHEAEVPIVPIETCKDVYEEYHITGNMFCAGYRRGRKDSCSGDSGGPLMCKDPKRGGRWTVFGITSFGEGCGKKGKYGIYARLSNYVRWIKRVIGLAIPKKTQSKTTIN